MNIVLRVIAVCCSLTLLAAYVWHSQVTPNTPPPDPLGLSNNQTETAPANSPQKQTQSDLRIISSKVINQPIFSVRKSIPFIPPTMFDSSKSGIVRLRIPSFTINGGLPTFDLFGEHKPAAPSR